MKVRGSVALYNPRTGESFRPIVVGLDAVRIGGIQGSVVIPIPSIVSILEDMGEKAVRSAETANIGAFYNADVWIIADAPFIMHTPFSEKSIRTIGFSIDDPSAFIAEVEKRRGASAKAQEPKVIQKLKPPN